MTNGGSYVIAQGAEVGRPSRLVCHIEAQAGVASSCLVSGRVQPVASGKLRVPPG
jgi:trans-2,3-dihydro-3-hydroxyanthranilate isomerase